MLQNLFTKPADGLRAAAMLLTVLAAVGYVFASPSLVLVGAWAVVGLLAVVMAGGEWGMGRMIELVLWVVAAVFAVYLLQPMGLLIAVIVGVVVLALYQFLGMRGLVEQLALKDDNFAPFATAWVALQLLGYFFAVPSVVSLVTPIVVVFLVLYLVHAVVDKVISFNEDDAINDGFDVVLHLVLAVVLFVMYGWLWFGAGVVVYAVARWVNSQ